MTEQLNIFVFGLLAPFVLPIINQVKTELNTGSSEIIQSSKDKQLIVFYEDESTDPTHSMLSKDHFSNVLNEPAGKIASQVLKWVVPQLIACWDDEQVDVDRTLTRIVNGVFNHPAQRDYGNDGAVDGRRLMFSVVEKWWGEKDEQERDILRDQLSRDGVENGRNHKEGVHDKGHGCGKPLGMPTYQTATSSGAVGGPATDAGRLAGEAVGGGALGGIVGSLVGSVGGELLGEALGGSEAKKQTSYQRYEQNVGYDEGGYSQRFTQESRSTYGGGYETTTERRYEQPSGEWHSEVRREGRDARGDSYDNSERYQGGISYERESDFGEKKGKKHKKKHHKHDSDSDNDKYQVYGERQRGYNTEERSRERDDYGESRYSGRESGNDYKKESDSDENREGKKHKKKHHKHDSDDSDSDNDKRKAYGERQRSYNTEERSSGYDGYGESRPEYGEGYGTRQDRHGYQAEGRDNDSSLAYGSGGYGDNDRRGSERDRYGSGEGGYGGQREEYGEDRGYGEERGYGEDREYGEDRGYGRGNEGRERRGDRSGYDEGDGY